MKAETYLKTYEHLYRQAERLTDEIKKLEEVVYAGGGAIRYDQDRVISSPGNGLTGVIDRKVMLEHVLSDTIDEMIRLKQDLEDIFSHLVNRDKKIAELTWLDFEGSVYISQKLHINRSTVFRRQQAIVRYVQEILDQPEQS